MAGKRGQITTEYVIIIGFMLIVLLVLWAQTTFTISSTTSDLRVAYARHAVTKIAEAADAVYVQGPPAKFSIFVTIPDNTVNAMVNGHEVLLSVYTYGDATDVYEETLGNVTGCIRYSVPGTHRISVEAVLVGTTNMVQITDGEGGTCS